MDALKFIEERNRMRDRYWNVDGDCDGCPLVDARECNELSNMVDDSGKAVIEAVEIVEKWSRSIRARRDRVCFWVSGRKRNYLMAS